MEGGRWRVEGEGVLGDPMLVAHAVGVEFRQDVPHQLGDDHEAVHRGRRGAKEVLGVGVGVGVRLWAGMDRSKGQ